MNIYKRLKDLFVNAIDYTFSSKESDLLIDMDHGSFDSEALTALSPRAAQIFKSKYGEFTPRDLELVRPADMHTYSDNKSSGLYPTPRYVYRVTINPDSFPVQDIESLEPITSTARARRKALEINPQVYTHPCGINVGLSTLFNKPDALNLYGSTKIEGAMYYTQTRPEFKNAVTWLATYRVKADAVILNSNDYYNFIHEWKKRYPSRSNQEASQYLQGLGYDGVKKWSNSPEIQWLNPEKSLHLKALKKQVPTRHINTMHPETMVTVEGLEPPTKGL